MDWKNLAESGMRSFWYEVSVSLKLLRLTNWSDLISYLRLIVVMGITLIAIVLREIDITFLITTVFIFLAQIFSFIVNDISDSELDALNPETRNPLASGEMSNRKGVVIALVFLFFSVFLLFLLPVKSQILGIMDLIICLTYSWGIRAKLKPVLDLLYHGIMFYSLPFVMIYTLYRSFDETCLLISLGLFILGLLPEILQEIRDYDFDRAFGNTTVVMLGKKKALILSIGIMSIWILITAKIFGKFLFFPVNLGNIIFPFQFLVLPPLSFYLLTPLIQGIRNESIQTNLHEKMKKRGIIVFMIVFLSTIGVYILNSTSYCYGNKYMDNYIVQLNVRTVIAGPERRDVAFIKFRYNDNANHYYLLLHRDGVLELTKVIASEKTFLKNVRTSLSPFDWHRFEITVEGSSIMVSVDDIIYLDIIDDSLSKGMVYLRGLCNARLAFFNSVKIFPIRSGG